MNGESINFNHMPVFGQHASGLIGSHELVKNTAATARILKIIRTVALISLSILAVGAAIALGIAPSLVLASLTGLGIGAIFFVSIAVFQYVAQYHNHHAICTTAGIIFDKSESSKESNHLEFSTCEAIATEHGTDTEIWREDLLKAAEHNIIVSGNYCGGKSFTNFLKLVDEQMNSKPLLKVVIISSPVFINKSNLQTIEELKRKYPNHFSLIESDDIWHVSTGLKKSTNHTKCMVIDYGKYFILGG